MKESELYGDLGNIWGKTEWSFTNKIILTLCSLGFKKSLYAINFVFNMV